MVAPDNRVTVFDLSISPPRIVQSLTAGTYFVIAKQFANYYPGGRYQVTLAAYQDQ